MRYIVDLRQKVMSFIDEGNTIEETSRIFKVGKSTISKWKKLRLESGSLNNRPLNIGFKKIDPELLKKYVEEHPDAYLKEMAVQFGCSDVGIIKTLRKLKITRKKKSKFSKNEMQTEGLNSERRYARFPKKT